MESDIERHTAHVTAEQRLNRNITIVEAYEIAMGQLREAEERRAEDHRAEAATPPPGLTPEMLSEGDQEMLDLLYFLARMTTDGWSETSQGDTADVYAWASKLLGDQQ